MATSAAVFYGDLATTWSLVRAAQAYQFIRKELLTMDLIITRQANRTLATSNDIVSKASISSCPAEVLSLIKDELYTIGIESVTQFWKEDVLEYGFGLFLADGDIPKKVKTWLDIEVRTTWEWTNWIEASPKPLYRHSTWGSNGGLRSLRDGSQLWLQSLLAPFKLRTLTSPIRDKLLRFEMSELWAGDVHLAFSQIKSSSLYLDEEGRRSADEAPSWKTTDIVVDLNLKTPHSRLEPALDFLYRKYQVDFIRSPKTNPLKDAAKVFRATQSRRNGRPPHRIREPATSAPNPRWMLWCSGDFSA